MALTVNVATFINNLPLIFAISFQPSALRAVVERSLLGQLFGTLTADC